MTTRLEERIVIKDSPPVIDRSVQRNQLDHDLAVMTSDIRGLPVVDVILALLRRAEDLAVIADERGEDLKLVRAFFSGDE
jgi:hypothetical protein